MDIRLIREAYPFPVQGYGPGLSACSYRIGGALLMYTADTP